MAQLIPSVDVPEGERGPWKVERFTVTKKDEDHGRMLAVCSSSAGGRYVPAGTYTALRRNGSIVMSDTPDEKRDHSYFVAVATGDVLITGLGLGMVANACLHKDSVASVTIIEKSQDVIELVASHWLSRWGERLSVIHSDALTWAPPKGRTWNSAWHDIWNDVCADNLPEMKRLVRRFCRRVDGYHACWGRERIRRYA